MRKPNGLDRRVDRFALANPLRWGVIAAVSVFAAGAAAWAVLQAVTDFQANWPFLVMLSIAVGLTQGWAARWRRRQRK